jgi:predicted nucleic acid-binding protein
MRSARHRAPEVIRVTEAAETTAEQWLRRWDDREFSWIDATSFATMQELRASDAFAFDGDFAAAGFTELRT